MKYYNKILKSTRPIMCLINDKIGEPSRVRIIFPDGSIIYDYSADFYEPLDFDYSCFNTVLNQPDFDSKKQSIEKMKKYDKKLKLKIVEVFVC